MQIQSLQLTHFRCHAFANFVFGERITAWVGPNGCGKTSVLEALHLLTLTRGFRPDRELPQRGNPYLTAELMLRTGEIWHLGYMEGRGKRLLINRNPVSRITDHIGRLPVVAVLPEDTLLLEGSGSERRAWLNGLLAQSDPAYLAALIRYDRALRQRNQLLLTFREQGALLPYAQLEPFDQILLEETPTLWYPRREFLRAFEPRFRATYRRLTTTTEEPLIEWDTALSDPGAAAALVHSARNTDLRTGRTTQGIHREDLRFLLDGMPVRHYGSQGQRKTFLIALKLAQLAFLEDRTGIAPLLLLDDVCERLDEYRIEALFQELATHTGQIAVTDTSEARLQAATETSPSAPAVIHRLGS